MNTVKVLDVTLRDGGYKTNFNFSDALIEKVLTTLDHSGIHYIEVGYRNGSFKHIPNIGRTGLCKSDYLEKCRKLIKYNKLTVICHPKNITTNDFAEMKLCGVDAVRICFPANNENLGFDYIEQAIASDLEVFVNITRASHYSQSTLNQLVEKLSRYKLEAIYLADSNGSFTPKKIDKIYSTLVMKTKIPFGFHAHDNLFLAQSNAITAINTGVTYIDASLAGIGKGAGNLRTEAIVTYLCSDKSRNFDLCSLLDISNFVDKEINTNFSKIKTKEIIMGIFDLSQDDMIHLGDFKNSKDYYINAKQLHSSSLNQTL